MPRRLHDNQIRVTYADGEQEIVTLSRRDPRAIESPVVGTMGHTPAGEEPVSVLTEDGHEGQP